MGARIARVRGAKRAVYFHQSPRSASAAAE
jgi:hypothetical protein